MSILDKKAKILWDIDNNDPKKVRNSVYMIHYIIQQLREGECKEVISILERSEPRYEVRSLLNEVLTDQLSELRKKDCFFRNIIVFCKSYRELILPI